MFIDDDVLTQRLVDLLMEYAYLQTDGRRLFLHTMVSNAFLRREGKKFGEKKEPNYLLNGVCSENINHVYLCGNAMRRMFYIGKNQWRRIVDAINLPERINRSHLTENVHAMSTCTQSVIDFLYDIAQREGESYATRYVRLLTGIAVRDSEKGATELPSSYSQRFLYEKFCFLRGHLAKSDANGSYGSLSNYPSRQHDDELGDLALWPSGSEKLDICTWATFKTIWNKYLPFVTIRSSAKDTCIDCHIFRNQQRYKNHVDYNPPSEADISCMALPRRAEETLESHESIIMRAAAHVKEALGQKAMAGKKIRAAKEGNGVVTLVIDYCQNLEVPFLPIDQPGDCYYFSPISVYCLGIVDTITDRLHAYVYPESAGAKGANNVVSFLYHFLKTNYFTNPISNCPLPSLNLIMDNCGGQNKNNTVIKACAYFVEVGWFKEVSINFLIKGHTKNSCDRCFNLLKQQYHKNNVYSFPHCLEVLRSCPMVEVIDATDLSYEWSKLLNSFYMNVVPGTVQRNHIFKFKVETIKRVQLKTKTSTIDKATLYQDIRLDHPKSCSKHNDKIRWLTIQKCSALLRPIVKPGLPPIKQFELYTKWRKVVPAVYKDITCPCPPREIVKMFRKKVHDEEPSDKPTPRGDDPVLENCKPKAKRKKPNKKNGAKKLNKRLTEILDNSDDSDYSAIGNTILNGAQPPPSNDSDDGLPISAMVQARLCKKPKARQTRKRATLTRRCRANPTTAMTQPSANDNDDDSTYEPPSNTNISNAQTNPPVDDDTITEADTAIENVIQNDVPASDVDHGQLFSDTDDETHLPDQHKDEDLATENNVQNDNSAQEHDDEPLLHHIDEDDQLLANDNKVVVDDAAKHDHPAPDNNDDTLFPDIVHSESESEHQAVNNNESLPPPVYTSVHPPQAHDESMKPPANPPVLQNESLPSLDTTQKLAKTRGKKILPQRPRPKRKRQPTNDEADTTTKKPNKMYTRRMRKVDLPPSSRTRNRRR